MDIIENSIETYINNKRDYKRKKKLNIIDLEDYVKNSIPAYYDIDGYQSFYNSIQNLVQKDILAPIKNKKTNGKNQTLSLEFWLNPKELSASWDSLDMLKMADVIDFSYYQNHPEWQNEQEWKRIQSVYQFLKQDTSHQMVSVEERSLMLFGHEKFLTDEKTFPEGKQFLIRIKKTPEDLFATKFGEPFVFWLKPGVTLNQIQSVLIVENLSFFHTAIKLLERNILDYDPQVVIYGEGKKIESSFSFFFKLFAEKKYSFYYVGDIDPEGYGIYTRLHQRYSDHNIQLATSIYEKMLQHKEQANDYTNQTEKLSERDFFLSKIESETIKQDLLSLWNTKKRVPQEVLTIETWSDGV